MTDKAKLDALAVSAMERTTEPYGEQLGTCDKKQYEHSGPHRQVTECGQSMPPFPCQNWKLVTDSRVSSKPEIPERFYMSVAQKSTGMNAVNTHEVVIVKDPDGAWVDYRDYVKLQSDRDYYKSEALANAEIAAQLRAEVETANKHLH